MEFLNKVQGVIIVFWILISYCLTVIEIAQDANSQNGNFLEHCGDIILHITYVEAV